VCSSDLLIFAAGLQVHRLLDVRAAMRLEVSGHAASIAPGQFLPAVELLDLDGGRTRLPELFTDRCGVVAFYSAACPYCRELAAQHTFRGGLKGVSVVWVSVPDHTAHALAFVLEFRLPGPTYVLGSWEDTRALGVGGTPRIVAVGQGARLLSIVSRSAPDIPESCLRGREP